MFNRKSIYALNKKDPNAIVYTDADGNLIRLTRDDFSNEEEFLRCSLFRSTSMYFILRSLFFKTSNTSGRSFKQGYIFK